MRSPPDLPVTRSEPVPVLVDVSERPPLSLVAAVLLSLLDCDAHPANASARGMQIWSMRYFMSLSLVV
jgi:hypothetical protein